jgi:hypothetical protein
MLTVHRVAGQWHVESNRTSCALAQLRYSGRKITASLGNVTVRGEKDGKGKGEARQRRVCLSMYSITENIYYSQLSSVALLLQPERNCFTSFNTRKGLSYLSLCAIVLRSFLPPTCLLVTVNEARSYFASNILQSYAGKMTYNMPRKR